MCLCAGAESNAVKMVSVVGVDTGGICGLGSSWWWAVWTGRHGAVMIMSVACWMVASRVMSWHEISSEVMGASL